MCANMLQSWIFEKSALNYRRCCFVLFIRSALTKPHCNLVPHNCTIATQLDPLQSQPQQHYNSCTESCSSMIFLSSIGYQSALVSLVHSTVSYFTWRNHRLATFPLHFLSVQLLIAHFWNHTSPWLICTWSYLFWYDFGWSELGLLIGEPRY